MVKNVRLASMLGTILGIELSASMMHRHEPEIEFAQPSLRRHRPKFNFYGNRAGEPRPVGVKFAEQYRKRYGSVSMNKTASGFLGFRKVRKFIPESGMSLWVPPGCRSDLPVMK